MTTAEERRFYQYRTILVGICRRLMQRGDEQPIPELKVDVESALPGMDYQVLVDAVAAVLGILLSQVHPDERAGALEDVLILIGEEAGLGLDVTMIPLTAPPAGGPIH